MEPKGYTVELSFGRLWECVFNDIMINLPTLFVISVCCCYCYCTGVPVSS